MLKAAGDSSEGNEECVIGTWKGDPSYTVAGSPQALNCVLQ